MHDFLSRKVRQIHRPDIKSIQVRPVLRVAAYCRVSTDHDDQLGSLSYQQNYYQELIESTSRWLLTGIYADRASGRNITRRPQFCQLLADCRSGLVDLIITKSISRFGRNTLDVLQICNELKSLDVNVFFEIEKLKLSEQHSDLLLSILAALHQNESEDKSRNIRWGIQRSFESPDSKYHNRICYGYRHGESGRLVIVEKEAEIVRDIFRLYMEGNSIREVIGELSNRNILSPNGHTKWSVECVRKILSNEKYTGNILLGKTVISNFLDGKKVRNDGQANKYLVTDCHPAIISQAQFDRVQDEKKRRKAGPVVRI
ncbi:MAG: recombinase family protein [Bacillota bacterium]|nr:recombinase family protein [Bacillota bacterium]